MSISIGAGSSTSADILKAVNQACSEAKEGLYPKRPSFALVFSTAEYASAYALNNIETILGNVPLIGSSGLYLIYNSAIIKQGIIVVLACLEKANYTLAHTHNIGRGAALNAGRELGDKLLFGIKGGQRNFCLVFGDGNINNGREVIRGLQEKLGFSFPIIGANSSLKGNTDKTYQYFNNELLSGSYVALLLGGGVSFGFSVHHGFKPLGRPRGITSSKGNVIFEIENKLAVKVYEDYFARKLPELKKDIRYISVLYPIGIDMPQEEEYLLRNVISLEENGAIICGADLPQQSSMRLMIATEESCLKSVKQSAIEARGNMERSGISKEKPPKCAFFFNNYSRYRLLGRHAARETEALRQTLEGGFPLTGFYDSGEYAPLKYYGTTRQHNQAGLVLTLGD
ncbi:MAG: FIST N-terminal domain-containing protein [Candidatus Omnitrophica bacterium]|nr:FIST N-terminal domain-containing protein [Candidatus Omnitrophota bacterium]